MNFMLETRHWVTMIIAVILAVSAVIFLPNVVAIYPITTYAFLIIALAVILDTLGHATEGRRASLKLAAWICLLWQR